MDDYREQHNTYEPPHHYAEPQVPPPPTTAVQAAEPLGLAVVGGFVKDHWLILLIILIGICLFLWLNKRDGGIKSLFSGLLKSSDESL